MKIIKKKITNKLQHKINIQFSIMEQKKNKTKRDFNYNL